MQEIAAEVDPEAVTSAAVEANIARCPDPAAAEAMIARIDEIRKTGNSVGGRWVCVWIVCVERDHRPVFFLSSSFIRCGTLLSLSLCPCRID